MDILFLPSIIEDIKTFDDPAFAKRLFNQVFDSSGNFRPGQNDHRYDDIDDAWIRYISRGATQYRLIYIQKGDKVYLYRAGNHSVENNLSEPSSFATGISAGTAFTPSITSSITSDDFGVLLPNTNPTFIHSTCGLEPTMLKTLVGSLYHVGHHDIVLVSPFYSMDIFSSFKPFGNFLDRCVEEGTNVIFVTCPPKDNDFCFFDELEARDILVYFCKNLHTKLYLFNVDEATLTYYNRSEIKKTAIVGSSNLTEKGFAFEGTNFNEELCYRAPECKFTELQQYSTYLINHSIDLRSYKNRARRY